MPKVIEIDLQWGIPPAQADQLISQGFTCLSKVTLGPGPNSIAVAGQQPVRIVDLWVSPPEPMVPQSFVAGLLVTLKTKGEGDWVTLDKIARAVFGIGLKELETRVQFPPPAGDPPRNERPDSEVVEDAGDAQGNILKFPGTNGG